jgi:hypothetical protein
MIDGIPGNFRGIHDGFQPFLVIISPAKLDGCHINIPGRGIIDRSG